LPWKNSNLQGKGNGQNQFGDESGSTGRTTAGKSEKSSTLTGMGGEPVKPDLLAPWPNAVSVPVGPPDMRPGAGTVCYCARLFRCLRVSPAKCGPEASPDFPYQRPLRWK
jgi:hypothetical protein